MRWEGNDLVVEILFSQAGLATQVLVGAGSTYLLFDAGDGTLRDLLKRGISPKKLAGVFITHGHADHMAGLWGLLGYLRAEGHTESFTIWYPQGACEVTEVLAAFRRCYGSTIPYELAEHPLSDGELVRLENVEVLARKLEHWHSIQGKPLAPAPALGYRITFLGQTVAITGDTAFHPGLEDLLRGADLALIEATLDDGAPRLQRAKLHLTLCSARRLARLAKAAVLIHRPDGRLLFLDPSDAAG